MDAWQLAGQAIEDLVAEAHEQDSENWAAIVPMADPPKGWGLELARWGSEATFIVERFSELIRMAVDVPESAIRTAGSKRLDEFQDYLEAKAGYSALRVAYNRSAALFEEWE